MANTKKKSGKNFPDAVKKIRSGGKAFRKDWKETPGKIDHITVFKFVDGEFIVGHDLQHNTWRVKLKVDDCLAQDWATE